MSFNIFKFNLLFLWLIKWSFLLIDLVPITDNPLTPIINYRRIKFASVEVNSPQEKYSVQSKDCIAIIDSRTTLIWSPREYVLKLNGYLGAIHDAESGLSVFGLDKSCNLANNTKDKVFNFKISNPSFSLGQTDYSFINGNFCYSVFVTHKSDKEKEWFFRRCILEEILYDLRLC